MNVKTNANLSMMIEEPTASEVETAWGIGAVGGCLYLLGIFLIISCQESFGSTGGGGDELIGCA